MDVLHNLFMAFMPLVEFEVSSAKIEGLWRKESTVYAQNW